MHRQFRRALDDAHGESRNALVIFFDVRGFSAFATLVDAVDTASYIKRIYQRALDDFFSYAAFFKPTGDGLMVVVEYDEHDVKEAARKVIESAFSLLEAFPLLAAGDPMVNFTVPDKAGIGIARGSACRLVSKGRVLDYSGRIVNLANRLMELARPEGLVLDGAFGLELLDDHRQKQFKRELVSIRGIAELVPPGHSIWVTNNVLIQESTRRSLVEIKWRTIKTDYPSIRAVGEAGHFRFILPSKPSSETTIRAVLEAPAVGPAGKPHRAHWVHFQVLTSELRYSDEPEGPVAFVRLDELAKRILAEGQRPSWKARLLISYEE